MQKNIDIVLSFSMIIGCSPCKYKENVSNYTSKRYYASICIKVLSSRVHSHKIYPVADFYSWTSFQFFEQYEKLLTSGNYVTRRQSLKVGCSKNLLHFYFQFMCLETNWWINLLWMVATVRVPFGASKLPYNETIHCRSSALQSHDDIAKGN